MIHINRERRTIAFQTEYSTVRGRLVSYYDIPTHGRWLAGRFDTGHAMPKLIEAGPMELIASGGDGWGVYAYPDLVNYEREPSLESPLFFGDHKDGRFAAHVFVQWMTKVAGGMPDDAFLAYAQQRVIKSMKEGRIVSEGVTLISNYLPDGPAGLLVGAAKPKSIYSRLFNDYRRKTA